MTSPNTGATGPLKPLNIRSKAVEVPAYDTFHQTIPPAHVTEGATLAPIPSGPLTFQLGLDRQDAIYFGLPDMRSGNLNVEDLSLGDDDAVNQAEIALMLQKVDAAINFVHQVEQSLEPIDKLLQQDLKLMHKELNQVETLMAQQGGTEAMPQTQDESLPDPSGELV